jgi:class 3 adenylate cyclase
VALAFAITSILLIFYDRLVTKRQEKTKNAALRVVDSLFPTAIQEKVLKGATDGGYSDQSNLIASFFPETTVMFADISGFTAWASTREPTQVFQLLEIIYGAFDEIARKKQIFKVETVGDCYVSKVEEKADYLAKTMNSHFSDLNLAAPSRLLWLECLIQDLITL